MPKLTHTSTRTQKVLQFKRINGFYPREEQCGSCDLPRAYHDSMETDCKFEKTGRKCQTTVRDSKARTGRP